MDATTDPGGVDERPHAARDLDLLVDRVARRSGDVTHDGAFLAGRLVQQARLADVRPAEQRHTARARELRLRDGGFLRKRLDHLVEEIRDPPAVQRGHGVRLAEAERPQLRRLRLLHRVVDLVRHQKDGLLRAPQQLHHALVGGRRSDARVDDEQHDVAQLDRDLRLQRDRRVDSFRVGFPAARVDEREGGAHPLGAVAHPVAGNARHILHDGLAAPENTVHERRLANVRAPDDRHHRQRLRHGPGESEVFTVVSNDREVVVFQVEAVERRAHRP